jgi:hypothetical protein
MQMPLRLTIATPMLDIWDGMDAEPTIAEIESLEHIFAVQDTRPLSPSDLVAANRDGTTKCSRIARGFGSGRGMVSVAERSPQYSD